MAPPRAPAGPGLAAALLLAVARGAGAAVSVPARPSSIDTCTCQDPLLGPGTCYEPVCPSGYYRCCATCQQAQCFSVLPMEVSWRGVLECIRCAPGDYCAGCDTFTRCPENLQQGREGPRISAAGSGRMADCESCPAGQEANFQRDGCMGIHRKACDETFVQRCMRGCEPEDLARRGNLTRCERLKCLMYCTKRASAACHRATYDYCRFLKGDPTSPDYYSDVGLPSLTDCDADCAAAAPRQPPALAFVAAVLALATALA